jgi:hypothetical protein
MKSSCPQREELMAYLDGELRPEPAAAATAHLEHCAECRAVVTDLRELSQQLAAWEATARPMEMPAALSSAVDAHVSAKKRSVAIRRRSWRQILGTRRLIWELGAVCGIVLLIMIAWTANKPSDSQEYYAGNIAAIKFKEKMPKGVFESAEVVNQKTNALTKDKNADQNGDIRYIGTLARKGLASVANDDDKPATPKGPMIVRTAQLSLITKDFNQARARAEEILKRHDGYIGELDVNIPENSGRTLTAIFRVPAAQLDAVLAELKKLGRVTSELQGGEEVTQQYVELEARLANARHTEQRLSELLRDRTGKLADVLAFEKEIDRVRGEIESMEAQRKSLAKQVDYATLNTTISEDYGAPLQLTPPSTSTRFRNAAVEGYQAVAGGVVSVLLFLLSTGPSLIILGAILFFAGRLIWRRVRARIA